MSFMQRQPQGAGYFHCLCYKEPEKKCLQVPTTVWSCQGWQANQEGSSQACHHCTFMTSRGVGLSPAPNVRQQSPDNVQMPETPPQSLDIIYLTCLKWVLNVIRLKVLVPKISLRVSSSNSWWQSSVRASV